VTQHPRVFSKAGSCVPDSHQGMAPERPSARGGDAPPTSGRWWQFPHANGRRRVARARMPACPAAKGVCAGRWGVRCRASSFDGSCGAHPLAAPRSTCAQGAGPGARLHHRTWTGGFDSGYHPARRGPAPRGGASADRSRPAGVAWHGALVRAHTRGGFRGGRAGRSGGTALNSCHALGVPMRAAKAGTGPVSRLGPSERGRGRAHGVAGDGHRRRAVSEAQRHSRQDPGVRRPTSSSFFFLEVERGPRRQEPLGGRVACLDKRRAWCGTCARGERLRNQRPATAADHPSTVVYSLRAAPMPPAPCDRGAGEAWCPGRASQAG